MRAELGVLLHSKAVWGLGWALIHSTWQLAVVGAVAGVALRALHGSNAATRYVVAYVALLSAPVAFGVTFVQLAVRTDTGAPWAWWSVLAPLGGVASWMALAWFIGLTLAFVRLFGGWLRIASLRSAHAGPSAWQDQVDVVARLMRIRRTVRLVETAAETVPGVIGWLSPVMLFPVSALSGLSATHVKLIFAHELAHVRRHDYLMNLAQTGIETLFFFHPAVWWLSARVRTEREFACDDLVVTRLGDRFEYALALTEIAQLRNRGTVGFALAATDGDLMARIRRLLTFRNADERALSIMAIGLHVAIMGFLMSQISAVATAPPITSASAFPLSLWFAVCVGMLLGMRHALEPDHLVAISTMVAEERSAFNAARLGLSWGLGHTLTLVIAGTILAAVRVDMSQGLSDGGEVMVAVMLVALGVRALRSAIRLGSQGPDAIHTHGGLVHRHAGSADHLHVGPWAVSRRPLVVGLVHGLAGSGALAAVVMAGLPSVASQIAYIVLFGLGSTAGMAALSGCAGVSLSGLSRRPETLAWISGAAGALSVVAGLCWGSPLVWNWL